MLELARKHNIELDEERLAEKRRERALRFHTELVPLFRLLGFTVGTTGIFLHRSLDPGPFDWEAFARYGAIYYSYVLFSWYVLRRYFANMAMKFVK